jgi:hypothetical protein
MRAAHLARRKRTVWLAILPALLLLMGTTVTANAATPVVGSLSFDPMAGTDVSPINFTTVSSGNTGCPAGSTNVRGLVNGPDRWTNIPVLSNTNSGVSTTSDFSEPLADTFSGLAQANGLTIVAGTYNMTIICQNRLGTTQYGSFNAPLYFTDATHFQSNDPNQIAQSTTTAVTASPASPQVEGTPVTFNAAVAPAGAAGSLQFKDGSTNLGAAQAVSAGRASITPAPTLSVGSHSITAVFTPTNTGAYAASTSAAVAYVISGATSAAATATTLAANPASPVMTGVSVTFTATVSPTTAGSVQLMDGSATVGSPQAVTGGQASISTSSLAVGTHSITAVFTPSNLAAFSGSTSAALPFTISAAPAAATSTALSASPSSMAGSGTTVTFTATVSPTGAAGSVQFKDGSEPLGSPQAVSAGQASFATNSLSVANHVIGAVFTPTDSSAYLASSAPTLPYSVIASAPTATTTTLGASPSSPAAFGAAVTFTATVSPAVSGTMQFKDGSTALGAPQAISAGQATLSSSTLSMGSHVVTADFTPADAGANAPSTPPAVNYVVNAAATNNLGTLTFLPAVGLDVTPIGITVKSTGTAKGCPVGATNVRAVVNGPTGWSNIPVLSNTNSGVSNTDDFEAPMADTFNGIASSNGVPITPGRYDFTLYCQNRLGTTIYGTFTGSLFFTDPTHYQSTDPSNTLISTTTALSVGPDARQDLGKPITFNATVTPASAVGAIQFTDTTQGLTVNLGAPVPLPLGANAVRVVSTLPFGLHTFAAKFIPADARRFSASASDNLIYVVALPAPPRLVRAAHLLGNGRLGSVLSCAATITGASSIGYTWYRNGNAINGAVRAGYQLVAADRLTLVACQVTAKNAGGVTPSMSPVAFVGLLSFRMYAAPGLFGSHRLGAVMFTDGGRWAPTPAMTQYVWRRDGKTIPGAVHQSYRVTKADGSHALSVQVTVGALFYNSAVAVSRNG